MKPLRLTLAGFLSYREPQTLDFSGFDIACISGVNGAGKSSLLDAITWVVFGQARKRDASLINTACDKAEVTLDFEYENQVYRVHRSITESKGTELEFLIAKGQDADGNFEWRTLSERKLRETEKLIESTLHLDYDTFVNASFFLQGKADMFAQQTPAERKRILGSILGLDVWEVYREQARKERGDQEGRLTRIDADLSAILTELAEEPARRKHLQEIEQQLAELTDKNTKLNADLEQWGKKEALLQAMQNAHSLLNTHLQNLERTQTSDHQKLQQRDQERQDHLALINQADDINHRHGLWQAMRKDLEDQDKLAERYRTIEAELLKPKQQIEAERARMGEALKNLEGNFARLQEAEAQLPELKTQLQAAEKAQTEAREQIEARQAMEEELKSLNQQMADANSENSRLKKEMTDLDKRINELKASEAAQCPLCGQELSLEHRQDLIAQLNEEGTALGDLYRDNRASMESFKQAMDEKEAAIRQLKAAEAYLRQAEVGLDRATNRIADIEKQRAEWDRDGDKRMLDLHGALAADDFLPEARQKLVEIHSRLDALGYEAGVHQQLRIDEKSARAMDKEYQQLGKAQSALVPLEREIGDLRKQKDERAKEIDSQAEQVTDSAARLAQEQAGMPDLVALRKGYHSAKDDENELRSAVGGAMQKVAVLADLKKRQKQLGVQREQVTRLIEDYKQLEKAFGKNGVPASLIEEAIPDIEEHANKTLSDLSNGLMSVSLETQREYKDANREDKKETLDIRISDGTGDRDYELYSGGEAFRVNFSIRLALARILAQRANASISTLVIDEGFGNQDAEGRERLVQAINLASKDFEKILVITHLEELKDFFPNRIEVEKTDAGSEITVV